MSRPWQILVGVTGLCVAAGLLYKHLRGSVRSAGSVEELLDKYARAGYPVYYVTYGADTLTQPQIRTVGRES